MTGPRIAVVEHQSTCPPALLGSWLTEAGCTLDVVRPYLGDPVPPALRPEGYAALLVLGGTMDADADDEAAWLPATRALLAHAAEDDVPALGVCLGHQLAALALGGEVARNPRGQTVGLRPIGWSPAAGSDDVFGRLPGPGVFWNQDVVARLPGTATELARAGTGELQAARFGARVWGVQWHPEADARVLATWAAQDADRHLELGLDQQAILTEVEAARGDLASAGRAIAEAFAREATG